MTNAALTGMDSLSYQNLEPFGMLVESTGGLGFDELPADVLSTWLAEVRVLVLRGFPLLDKPEFAEACRRFGSVVTWNFGEVLDLVVHDDPQNYLFDAGDVPFHWDGAFVEANPAMFLFQCVHAEDGAGGETVFCDTTAVCRDAGDELMKRWAGITAAYTTEKVAHYGGAVSHPLLARHPRTGEQTIRYAEPLPAHTYLNPLSVQLDGVPAGETDAVLSDLAERLHRPEYCYAHEWRTGDIVIADNDALVHGRNAFTDNTSRHLQRVQVEESQS